MSIRSGWLAVGVLVWVGGLASGEAHAFARKWVRVRSESFEGRAPLAEPAAWALEAYTDPDRYADNGSYFRDKDPLFVPPIAFRSSTGVGEGAWLQLQSYTRDPATAQRSLADVVADPADPSNKVLRISSPVHTDGTVLRPAFPLPPQYRVCARVGHASFGTGFISDRDNGYLGGETADPWLKGFPSHHENGLYWMAILDVEPMPRNNVYIHHHRKVVIDSDNNDYPEGGPWSHVWNGDRFARSGDHIVMMFAVDATEGVGNPRSGQPFISWAAGQWNSEVQRRQIRAADAYLEGEWYRVCIAKTDKEFKLSNTGRFRYGGERTYEGSIPLDEVYRAKEGPDFFQIGDPHANFYRGEMYVDDVTLEVPSGG